MSDFPLQISVTFLVFCQFWWKIENADMSVKIFTIFISFKSVLVVFLWQVCVYIFCVKKSCKYDGNGGIYCVWLNSYSTIDRVTYHDQLTLHKFPDDAGWQRLGAWGRLRNRDQLIFVPRVYLLNKIQRKQTSVRKFTKYSAV